MSPELAKALTSVKPVYLADILRPKAPAKDPRFVVDPENPIEVVNKTLPYLEKGPSFITFMLKDG